MTNGEHATLLLSNGETMRIHETAGDLLDRIAEAFGPAEPEPVEGPHSRACGIHPHPHGSQCSTDCPTCLGREPV